MESDIMKKTATMGTALAYFAINGKNNVIINKYFTVDHRLTLWMRHAT